MSAFTFVFESFDCDTAKIIKTRGVEDGGRVQQFIDSECLKLCEPFVPKDAGNLIESGIIHTKIGSGEVRYSTPYARRWYYMPAAFQEAPERGNYWFDRMKAQYRDQILKGAQKEAGNG